MMLKKTNLKINTTSLHAFSCSTTFLTSKDIISDTDIKEYTCTFIIKIKARNYTKGVLERKKLREIKFP